MTDGISAADRHSRTLTEEDFKNAEIDCIIARELDYIRKFPHWVCVWWTPTYEKARKKELLQDIESKNTDIEYIKQQKTKHIGIGTPITERPSHSTGHTDRVSGGSADQGRHR